MLEENNTCQYPIEGPKISADIIPVAYAGTPGTCFFRSLMLVTCARALNSVHLAAPIHHFHCIVVVLKWGHPSSAVPTTTARCMTTSLKLAYFSHKCMQRPPAHEVPTSGESRANHIDLFHMLTSQSGYIFSHHLTQRGNKILQLNLLALKGLHCVEDVASGEDLLRKGGGGLSVGRHQQHAWEAQ